MSKPGPARRVSDDEIVDAIKQVDAPVASTTDVAQKTGLGRQGVLERLKPLEEEGLIASKKIGNSYGWYVL